MCKFWEAIRRQASSKNNNKKEKKTKKIPSIAAMARFAFAWSVLLPPPVGMAAIDARKKFDEFLGVFTRGLGNN